MLASYVGRTSASHIRWRMTSPWAWCGHQHDRSTLCSFDIASSSARARSAAPIMACSRASSSAARGGANMLNGSRRRNIARSGLMAASKQRHRSGSNVAKRQKHRVNALAVSRRAASSRPQRSEAARDINVVAQAASKKAACVAALPGGVAAKWRVATCTWRRHDVA